jgi:hypothetical protein
MVFIGTYNSAMKILAQIGTGTCKGECKSSWIRNLKYALKTKTNPLGLTTEQRKNVTAKIKQVSKRNAINEHTKTLKKYKNRKSPPFSANENCNKTMKGNDGNMYISQPNKNNVCSWKKVSDS